MDASIPDMPAPSRRRYGGVLPEERQRLRRAKLIEGALEVFGTKGFHVATVRDICVAAHLTERGLEVELVNKVAQGRPHIVDRMVDGGIDLVFNTTEGWQSLQDSQSIRASALAADIAYYTTAAASDAATQAIGALRAHSLEVKPLQDYY